MVEAGWKLGDRHLYLRRPYLRGDDVVDLQGRLSRLGFDCGRVDGIFGPGTSAAVSDFQRNVGLASDGVVGHETFRSLQRLAARSASGQPVGEVRESLRLDALVAQPRLVVGHGDNLAPLARAIARAMRASGATVLLVDDLDPRINAQMANRYDAHAYVALSFESDDSWVAFYEVPGFSSVGGRRLAERISGRLGEGQCYPVRGMRLPILRETRMPAVVIEFDPAHMTADRRPVVAASVVSAVREWCGGPQPAS